MKRNNFFISLLICFGLMFAVSSCNDKERPLVCGENVIICADVFENTLDLSEQCIGISNLRIEGNYLKMTISAGGFDASRWIVKLVTNGNVYFPTFQPPPTRRFRIFFENPIESSRSKIESRSQLPISREFSFNIECLQVPNENRMFLEISGTEHSLLYEW